MGKTNQERIKRKLAQARRNAGKAFSDLFELAELYEESHDELADVLKTCCLTLDATCAGIDAFCIGAWGRIPTNWESWRNARQRDPDPGHGA